MQITSCRVCDNQKLNPIFNLGDQVLTGRFPKTPDEKITSGPLSIVQCDLTNGCGLVQLEHSYDLDEMYGESYGYRSGLNKSMVEHLRTKVDDILTRGWLSDGDVILDIGSNDGTTLGHYPENRFKLIGIDPSAQKFGQYYRSDIIRVPDFFNAKNFNEKFPDQKAKIVTSFSMFYDLESPLEFAHDISDILAEDGVWCFEQSYIPAMLSANSFDTICHEHLEYYGLTQIVDILERVGMIVLDVTFNNVNGGSFSIFAGKRDGPHYVNSETVNSVLVEEENADYKSGAPFEAFKQGIEVERQALMSFLEKAKDDGKTVVGLGASTKGNVLLQYYGITAELVAAIAEVNPDKYGCYTPGTAIPIRPQSEVLQENPDYLLVLPWHFRDFFEKLPALQGRNLVFPLPNFEIVSIGT